jgi:hypothetical protein
VSARQSSASEPLSKELVQAKLAQSWARTIANQFKGNKTKFAAAIGCCPDTVSNALAGNTVPELHTAFNSLLACPNALDELAALFGFALVPRDAQMTPDMVTLAQMSKAMAEFIDALRDGKRTHTETLELAEELRPLIPRLTAIVREAEGLKEVA